MKEESASMSMRDLLKPRAKSLTERQLRRLVVRETHDARETTGLLDGLEDAVYNLVRAALARRKSLSREWEAYRSAMKRLRSAL